MAELKRTPINRVIKKGSMLSISKKEFLVGLGVSDEAADKLLKLDGINAFCIIDSDCSSNCNGKTANSKISIDIINSLIDENVLTVNDINKDVLSKIRK